MSIGHLEGRLGTMTSWRDKGGVEGLALGSFFSPHKNRIGSSKFFSLQKKLIIRTTLSLCILIVELEELAIGYSDRIAAIPGPMKKEVNWDQAVPCRSAAQNTLKVVCLNDRGGSSQSVSLKISPFRRSRPLGLTIRIP